MKHTNKMCNKYKNTALLSKALYSVDWHSPISFTHSHIDSRVNHTGRQPAGQEQSGWGVLRHVQCVVICIADRWTMSAQSFRLVHSSFPILIINLESEVIPHLGFQWQGGVFKLRFPVVVRHAVHSLFASHQSTHKQSRSQLLRTCEPSLRLNDQGGNPTSSFKLCTAKQAITFAILTLCAPHLRTAVHLCNRTEVSLPWRFGTNTCTVTPLVSMYVCIVCMHVCIVSMFVCIVSMYVCIVSMYVCRRVYVCMNMF